MLSPEEIRRGKDYLARKVPFPSPEIFRITRELESSFPGIRAEVKTLMSEKVWSPYFAKDTYEGDWDLFWIKAKDGKSPSNARLTPLTTSLVDRFPEIKYAAFSALQPGSVIPPHEGIPGIVRIHFGVHAEKGASGWCVGGQIRECIEGKVVIFEDGFQHEAWNRGLKPRITLMLTTTAPEFSSVESSETYRVHDKKYGFQYLIEKGFKRFGRAGEMGYKWISPVISFLDPWVGKLTKHLTPVFVLFMVRSGRKSLVKNEKEH